MPMLKYKLNYDLIQGSVVLPCFDKFAKVHDDIIKFIYSEKATKFCEIFPLLLTVCTVVKSKGKISQNFVAFSEYMNFICIYKVNMFFETLRYSQTMNFNRKKCS